MCSIVVSVIIIVSISIVQPVVIVQMRENDKMIDRGLVVVQFNQRQGDSTVHQIMMEGTWTTSGLNERFDSLLISCSPITCVNSSSVLYPFPCCRLCQRASRQQQQQQLLHLHPLFKVDFYYISSKILAVKLAYYFLK